MSITEASSAKKYSSQPLAPGVKSNELSTLLQNESRIFDLATDRFCAPEDIGLKVISPRGEAAGVVSVFRLDDESPKTAAVVVLHDPKTYINRVFLAGLDESDDGTLRVNNTWLPVVNGKTMVIGRLGDRVDDSVVGAKKLWPLTDGFNLNVSRRHLTLTCEDRTLIFTDTSQGGTRIPSTQVGIDKIVAQEEFGHLDTHTVHKVDLARERGQLVKDDSGVEKFAGRGVITRETTDPEGRVDIRSWGYGGESIVVDSSTDPEIYTDLLNSCKERFEPGGLFTRTDVLKAIYETIVKQIEYDLDFANKTAAETTSSHKKINLSVYIGSKKAVCRHMALMAQWMGARLAEEYPQLFKGSKFTVPVNQRVSDNSAHEWTRFTDANGNVQIIDPAQHFFGSLEDVIRDNSPRFRFKSDVPKRWEYFASAEEKIHYESKVLGGLGVGRLKGRLFAKEQK